MNINGSSFHYKKFFIFSFCFLFLTLSADSTSISRPCENFDDTVVKVSDDEVTVDHDNKSSDTVTTNKDQAMSVLEHKAVEVDDIEKHPQPLLLSEQPAIDLACKELVQSEESMRAAIEVDAAEQSLKIEKFMQEQRPEMQTSVVEGHAEKSSVENSALMEDADVMTLQQAESTEETVTSEGVNLLKQSEENMRATIEVEAVEQSLKIEKSMHEQKLEMQSAVVETPLKRQPFDALTLLQAESIEKKARSDKKTSLEDGSFRSLEFADVVTSLKQGGQSLDVVARSIGSHVMQTLRDIKQEVVNTPSMQEDRENTTEAVAIETKKNNEEVKPEVDKTQDGQCSSELAGKYIDIPTVNNDFIVNDSVLSEKQVEIIDGMNGQDETEKSLLSDEVEKNKLDVLNDMSDSSELAIKSDIAPDKSVQEVQVEVAGIGSMTALGLTAAGFVGVALLVYQAYQYWLISHADGAQLIKAIVEKSTQLERQQSIACLEKWTNMTLKDGAEQKTFARPLLTQGELTAVLKKVGNVKPVHNRKLLYVMLLLTFELSEKDTHAIIAKLAVL